jgi:hypothetical protein
MPHETIDELDRRRLHSKFGMVRPEPLRDVSRGAGFVERRSSLESYGERLDRRIHEAAHHAHNDGRIDAGAQKRAERNVADQASSHGAGHELADALARGLAIDAQLLAGFRKPQLPISPRLSPAICVDDNDAGRLDVRHALIERRRMRHVAE